MTCEVQIEAADNISVFMVLCRCRVGRHDSAVLLFADVSYCKLQSHPKVETASCAWDLSVFSPPSIVYRGLVALKSCDKQEARSGPWNGQRKEHLS